MEATYVFRVTFRLASTAVETDPSRFETVVRYPVSAPGEGEGESEDDGETGEWRFFERWLWHGSLTDSQRFSERMAAWLGGGVRVEQVTFSELVVDEAYRTALRDAVSNEVDRYNADSAREVLHNHLGSSIRVRDE